MIALTVSAWSRNPFVAIILSFFVYVLPNFDFSQFPLYRILRLFPLNTIGSMSLLADADFYSVFGFLVAPKMLVAIFSAAVIFVFMLLCFPIGKCRESSN
jgi:hypothetical protein